MLTKGGQITIGHETYEIFTLRVDRLGPRRRSLLLTNLSCDSMVLAYRNIKDKLIKSRNIAQTGADDKYQQARSVSLCKINKYH
jgi:hypothetical protein